MDKAARMEVDLEPPKKTFTKKCLNVATLDSYNELELENNGVWWDTWTFLGIFSPLCLGWIGENCNFGNCTFITKERSIIVSNPSPVDFHLRL